MPAQIAQVDVTFLVDANGLLTVCAKEQRSGRAETVTVQAAHGLNQDEVERLVLESVEHAHDDFTARRFIELKNKADADLRLTDKGIEAADDQIDAAERQRVEAAIAVVAPPRTATTQTRCKPPWANWPRRRNRWPSE